MTQQGDIIVRDAPRTGDRRGDRGRSERAWRRRPSTGVAAVGSAPADLAASGALAAISIATAVAMPGNQLSHGEDFHTDTTPG